MKGYRTYATGLVLIAHQVLKMTGIDVDDALISESMDAVLALGMLYFRWAAVVVKTEAKKEE